MVTSILFIPSPLQDKYNFATLNWTMSLSHCLVYRFVLQSNTCIVLWLDWKVKVNVKSYICFLIHKTTLPLPLLPLLTQSTFCFHSLFVYMDLCSPHMKENMTYLSFWSDLLFCNAMISSCSYFHVKDIIVVFFVTL